MKDITKFFRVGQKLKISSRKEPIEILKVGESGFDFKGSKNAIGRIIQNKNDKRVFYEIYGQKYRRITFK